MLCLGSRITKQFFSILAERTIGLLMVPCWSSNAWAALRRNCPAINVLVDILVFYDILVVRVPSGASVKPGRWSTKGMLELFKFVTPL